ncbi:outer-membrane lipoprotein carrier protein [Lysobacter xinjiangensis]|uniref:Outer-membrane lipoprotein carrier protein n=1 Tax=Cognatilysobacter xinjiangensis TaxID=546892 RepID=A0ABQ3BZQ3_9GAMM|nr:outer membrane lipoprotein chaperone LolA [Lysobacter xinjiangensis]GGZ57671.1 outer-membrane lipoprotein carrier protein [Lysobacter xinjiangensis]
MRSMTTFVAAGLMLFAGAASAGARDQLDSFTKGLKTLDGRFTQQVFDAKGKLKESSSGRVALSAPRQFRWEYAKPYPQQIVADGKTVWIYEPDLQQVTKRAQGAEERSSPLTALIDPSKLDAQFAVQESGTSNGLEWVTLTPKGDASSAGFRTAKLGFGPQGLSRMQVVDQLGQRTDISFSAWKRNGAMPAATFRFTPPKGVDVIGG